MITPVTQVVDVSEWKKASLPAAAPSGTKTFVIDNGWSGIQQIFADGNTIFAIDLAGNLWWYGYDPTTRDWQSGLGNVVGTGWGSVTHVAYAGDGVFYAVNTSGTLFSYRYRPDLHVHLGGRLVEHVRSWRVLCGHSRRGSPP
jgi:hypothetical protein